MKYHRRQFLHLAAGTASVPLISQVTRAQTDPAQPERQNRPLAERLALYADGLHYEDLDVATIEQVKAHLIDTLGCGLAAFDEGPVKTCREIALGVNGTATILGTSRGSTADLATFANGAAFRYYDLNDVYVGHGACHPSDNIAACLAVAESEHSSAADLILAIAIAYEINSRLIDDFDLTVRGWDDATVFSLPSVALASGKLMKLPPNKLAHAVNLAINDHIPMGQTRAQALSDWKGLADAEAGRNAVFATILARGGLTGPAPIFEGRRGFFQLVSGTTEIDVATFGRRDVPFKISQCGMKAFPVVVYGQTAVVAGIALAEQVGNLDRIAALEIETTGPGYLSAGKDPEKWTPETRDTADHSLPYVVARAMFDGDLNNESYAPDKLRDPRIRTFMRKITVRADPSFAAPRGSAPPTRITAILDDGKRITRQINSAPGFASQPMTRPDIEKKFRSNVGERWSQERTDAVLQSLWALEQIDDVRQLLSNLAT